MQPFSTLTAPAAPIVADDVDTDQIFPGRFASKDRRDGQYGSYLLHDLRFDENGEPRRDFVLNVPGFSDARIVVAAANYACGSARYGAIFSHLDFGIRVILAESFGAVFAEIAYKFGLLTIPLPKAALADLRGQLLSRPGAKLTVDLPSQTITAPNGATLRFEIDGLVKRMLLSGLDEVDLTLASRDKVEAFEAAHREDLPWIFDGTRSLG